MEVPIVPSAGVAILDEEGRILLGRRRDDGRWCLPGGRLEAGESFTACARREAREELGAEVTLHGVVAVLSDPANQLHIYPDGRRAHFVGVVFAGRLASSPSGGDGELTELRWFAAADLVVHETMAADLPAIRHALTGADPPLVE